MLLRTFLDVGMFQLAGRHNAVLSGQFALLIRGAHARPKDNIPFFILMDFSALERPEETFSKNFLS